MPDVYISYSHSDSEAMRAIANALRGHGLDVWADEALNVSTSGWTETAEDAIRASKLVVAMLSPNAKQSDWVRAELDFARVIERRIFPVLVSGDERTSVPFGLTRAQSLDARDGDYQSVARRIADVFFRLHGRKDEVKEPVARPDDAPVRSLSPVRASLQEGQTFQKNGLNDKAVDRYAEVLRDRMDSEARITAVTALGEMRLGGRLLATALADDPDPKVREASVRAFANLRSPEMGRVLRLSAVADDNVRVRVFVGIVERFFRNPSEIGPWLRVLQNSQNSELQSVVNEAQLYANELVAEAGHVFISYSRADAEEFALDLAA
ncbi:MAG: toll/interleukin-1 receptor domain-containing protein, partial [Anaerolineae bacterium]|nr:toll/interleukin-1 receptor domain-containing protein [Anaerolineae bacterium]